jgi:hypothetical protein
MYILICVPFIILYSPQFIMYREKYNIKTNVYLSTTESISFWDAIKLWALIYQSNFQ